MKKIAFYLLCLLMAMQVTSCSKNKAEAGTSAQEENQASQDDFAGTVSVDEAAQELLESTIKAEEQNNDFSFRLWAMIDQEGENAFFSPYSINTALAMVYNGSKGNTATELARVMGYDFAPETAHPTLTKMQEKLNQAEEAEVSVANAIFTAEENQDRLLPDYLELLKKEYLAQHQSLNFAQAQETANFINKWVAEKTRNRIKDMVDAGQVKGSNNGLFLANAIYFKATWLNQFDKYSTREDVFYTSSARRKEESKQIDMMQIKAHFPYAKIPGYQLLELPYEDPEFAMLLVLPDEIKGIKADLSAKTLIEWQNALSRPRKVKVFIPRFKMEESLDKLVNIFQDMGMKDAFSGSRADFSGIMKYVPSANLYISSIAHKAFLEVKEAGTEAAAATVIGMATSSMPPPEPEMPVFRADKPFLCLILHKPDNTILFAGKVVNPEAAEE
ncbi:MAG: serpin family protein [Candidatus Cloacimonetes bacterium]|jgi:serpin B|nr:serpin family protein [Candidatus Cloacimonadota bacterium]MCB5288496.1 serpin family protein [Candidatus Cloacimonadota bacterium]MCK9185373.1 serpin family protein [Candidatus Cloacimonadota bacterium]MCK9585204.1 serpin family protein [Candidatus Cloacimonadota bacterium]MDY0230797.1 serpin family protein [Candidatus Cloacimonadaceae bacterium]